MNPYFATRTVVTEEGCWEWRLSRGAAGYGQATVRSRYKRPVGAHRLSYEMHVGPIPDGLTVDHWCFNPPCVNPEHLRLLTLSENASHQLDSYKTHCIRGHEFTSENTRFKDYGNGRRECRTCHRERERAAWTRRMEGVPRKGQARGERAGRAVLTESAVIAIRRRRADGETVSGLAREYGVSRGAIQSIVKGLTWAHIPAEVKA